MRAYREHRGVQENPNRALIVTAEGLTPPSGLTPKHLRLTD